MDKELAKRAHSLFMEAIELDADERASFLVERCDEDPALREHVQRLLDALNNSNEFLQEPAHAAAAVSDAWTKIPTSINNYRIVRTLGVGGMATVYEAIQEQPERRVALKVLRQGLAHGAGIERFRFETEVLASLQHPGIAQIFEAGTYDDGSGASLPFFAMEYIADASPITTYAQRHHLSIEERLELFQSVCEAVLHGHQHGVIHRDLKPGNILVDGRGFAKVIDFGVARPSDPSAASITRDTDLGQLVGTLNYMSPEQCAGVSLDTRTDVYSLGVILYEMVCRQLPHDLSRRPVPEALRIISEDPIPHPRTIHPGLPSDVDAIVMKALRKDPAARYPTPAALGADIRRHLAFESVEARQPTMFYRMSRFVRRHRLLIGATSLVFLAVIVGALVSGTFAYRTWRESIRRMEAEAQAIADRDEALWQSYVANIAAAQGATQIEEYPHAKTRLLQTPSQHRGWEWRLLSRIVENSEVVTDAHEDMVFGFDMAPTRTRLATGGRDGGLRIWNGDMTTLIADASATTIGAVYEVAFNRTGTAVVTAAADGTARVWDATTGAPTGIICRHEGEVRSVDWSSGGILGVASTDGIGRLWDPCDGDVLEVFADQPGGVHRIGFMPNGDAVYTWGRHNEVWLRDMDGTVLQSFAFDGLILAVEPGPDGTMLAIGGANGFLKLWDVSTGEVILDVTDPENPSTVRTIAFSPDGSLLAAGHTTRSIAVYSTATGELVRNFHGHAEAVSGLAFSADGERLFSSSWDRTVRQWDLTEKNPANLVLHGHEHHVLGVTFSPDGEQLASCSRDRTIRLWDLQSNRLMQTLSGHTYVVSDVAYSPDGSMLASSSYDRTIRLWHPATGECLRILKGHRSAVWTVTFSRDGQLLASCGDDRTIRIWDVQSGETRQTLRGHEARTNHVAFSPDGQWVASGSRDHTVRIWRTDSGELVHDLRGHESDVFAVLFSPDGTRLFSGSRDQSIRVWDTETGSCLRVLEGHGQFITCLSIWGEGRRLAAGSWFGDIVMWDLDRLDVVASFKASRHAVRGLAFSADGRRLASGDYENQVRVYDSGGE